MVSKNKSAYIPVRDIYAVENGGCILLESLKKSSALYLGEDDIVKLTVLYGRASDQLPATSRPH